MNVFDIIAGTASILGLVISLIGLVVSGFTLYEVKKPLTLPSATGTSNCC